MKRRKPRDPNKAAHMARLRKEMGPDAAKSTFCAPVDLDYHRAQIRRMRQGTEGENTPM